MDGLAPLPVDVPSSGELSLWDLVHDLVATVGRDGRIENCNARWTTVLGWSPDELRAGPLDRFSHPDDRERTLSQHARGLAGGANATGFENRVVCQDGSYRWMRWSQSQAASSGQFLLVGHDITERKRRDARLEQLVLRRTEQLDEANRELEAFSYSVAHDLRAPLRAIDGYSQILLEDHGDTFPPDALADLTRIRAATQRMSNLIDEMLALALISRQVPGLITVDISALADAVIDEYRAGDPTRDVQIAVTPGIEVHADEELMRVVLQNLLGNAWKFTQDNPAAQITVTPAPQESGDAGFVVRDNGAGFDQRYADKLFLPFERLHRHDQYAGSGVGLATVGRIVARHHGRVRGEGWPGTGAQFTLHLPNVGTSP